MERQKDYTCVPTPELAAAFHKHRDKAVPMAAIAERVGIDVRDLKKVVNLMKYRTTGVGLADRILCGIGQNITHLEVIGELTVIPSPGPDNPTLMARDEWYARQMFGGKAPGPQERERRPKELAELRRATLAKYA